MNYKNQTPVSTVNSVNEIERRALELAADGKYEIAAELFYKAALEAELHNGIHIFQLICGEIEDATSSVHLTSWRV